MPHIPLILAVDVHYEGDQATAAGVLFEGWDACIATQTALAHLANVADYEPGEFYKRELPGDGYVYLGHSQQPGWGKHLFDAPNGRCLQARHPHCTSINRIPHLTQPITPEFACQHCLSAVFYWTNLTSHVPARWPTRLPAAIRCWPIRWT